MSQVFVRTLASVLAVVICTVFASAQPRAQDGPVLQPEDSAAPPPMKHIPDATRAQLAAASDVKARTRLMLELAEERLARAAEHTAAERFEEASGELGVYEALVEDGIRSLRNSGKPANRNRDLFKRIELALRSHLPRIETIRRTTPSLNAVHVKATLDFVRNARSDALNAFYDDTVIPDASDNKDASPDDQQHVKGSRSVARDKETKP
jgi:hypothetical protein